MERCGRSKRERSGEANERKRTPCTRFDLHNTVHSVIIFGFYFFDAFDEFTLFLVSFSFIKQRICFLTFLNCMPSALRWHFFTRTSIPNGFWKLFSSRLQVEDPSFRRDADLKFTYSDKFKKFSICAVRRH